MPKPDNRRTVHLKPTSYKPSKAELDEPIILTNPDGSRPTPGDVAHAIVQPVRIIRDPD